jgi:hypothetical protein
MSKVNTCVTPDAFKLQVRKLELIRIHVSQVSFVHFVSTMRFQDPHIIQGHFMSWLWNIMYFWANVIDVLDNNVGTFPKSSVAILSDRLERQSQTWHRDIYSFTDYYLTAHKTQI